MNRDHYRTLAMIVAVVLATFAVAACAGQEAAEVDEDTATEAVEAVDEASEAETGEAEAGAPGEAVELRFLTLDDPDQLLALEAMIEAWKQSDPQWANAEVTVDAVPFAQLFPQIEASVAAGADFDAFLADGPDIKHYAYNGAIISLAEYYTEEELNEWVPQSVEEGSYLDEFYAPPVMQSCSMMFYNADYTDAAGLQPPAEVEGWTIAEAWDAWEKTTVDNTGDGTPDIWGLRWGQGTWWGDYEQGIPRRSAGERGTPTFEGVGPDGITFHGYIDTPEAIDAYETYRAWHIGDRAVTPVEPIPDIFVGGQAAFMVSPDNRIGQINRLYPEGDFNYGVTGIPYFADGSQLCHTGSWHFGVSPNTPNREATVAMVKFFAGPEGSRIWYDHVRQLPARFDLLNTLPEYNEYPQQLFAQGLQEIGVPRIQTPCYTEYQQIHAELLQNVSQGRDVDVEELVRNAATNMEQACAKYAGWNE
ncbi:MAG: extracellular solute-binding protein [Chloroflexota bacterium]|nr:extracellular solute-binding protein [Chloroflexota bacterium]